ncbi:DUF4824 family protein [Sulfurovum sp.]|jgi:hypothetical protein|uniref:DUF4824 family protein n=1 Tax=Sulfurovum sp. TaxID=1969726 RepID=UPI002A35C753|nr:DUF4824 family protein [Sulfurovum sp.]MDD2226911.1 DUF4824 family protein [Dysgonamonadaceae bacterium]MDD3495751.1 DUF4824 family protein [Dysgonamonadaceae bacterium]MDY0403901.1 DUF4824 family protein [Sulfurovum sp.]
MKNHYAKKLFWIAFFLLAGTNLIVLFGVYHNRSGEPGAQLIVTERELQAPYRISDENSGLALHIIWRSPGKKNEMYGFGNWLSPEWLDAEKLKSLGFNIDPSTEKKYDDYDGYSATKERFIVLEFDAEAYDANLQEAVEALKVQEAALKSDPENESLQKLFKREKERVESIRNYDTRLYAIDAGTDPQILEAKYPEKSRYIIAKAQIRLSYNVQSKEVYGSIPRLSVHSVHVPKKFRSVIDPILHYAEQKGTSFKRHDTTVPHAPRYKVTLAYGKRYEPWIISIEPLNN